MNWKFWQKKEIPAAVTGAKLPKPKELSNAVGRYLVVNLKHDPDWVWRLKGVSRPRENSNAAFDIRIFDENVSSAKGIAIRDFTSLDAHQELVLFEGWYEKENWKVELRENKSVSTHPTAA